MKQFCRLVIITIPLLCGTASAQYLNAVTRITADTYSGLRFSAWVKSSEFPTGRDLSVLFSVRNRGRRTIYLVMERMPKVYTEDDIVVVGEAFPTSGVEINGRFAFYTVIPGGTYRGRITVPSEFLKQEGLLEIRVGIVYVYDKSELDRLVRPGEDPARYAGEFTYQEHTVDLGTLQISVASPAVSR